MVETFAREGGFTVQVPGDESQAIAQFPGRAEFLPTTHSEFHGELSAFDRPCEKRLQVDLGTRRREMLSRIKRQDRERPMPGDTAIQ